MSWFDEVVSFEFFQKWFLEFFGLITKIARSLFLPFDLEVNLSYPKFSILPFRFDGWGEWSFNLGTVPPLLELTFDLLLGFIVLKVLLSVIKVILDALPVV